MADKHPPDPNPAGEAPVTPPLGTSAEKELDPSHFGVYEFAPGLREELIRAEKPRLDPKLLQDTVPPNRKPVVTEPDRVATTPRGGFVAPKAGAGVDRDAVTLVALPVPEQAPSPPTASTPPAPSSAPPVDTSRTQDTVFLPAIRHKRKHTRLIAAVAFLAFVVIGIAVGWTRGEDQAAGHAVPHEAAVVVSPPPVVSLSAVAKAPEAEGTPITPTTAAPESAAIPSPAPVPSSKKNHASTTASAPAARHVSSGISDAAVERTTKPETAPAAPAPSAKRKFPFSAP